MDLINRLATLAGRGDAARLQGYQTVAAPFIEAIPAAIMTSRPVRREWARDSFVVPSRDHPWMAAILDAPDAARTAIAISLIERAFRPDAYRDPIAYGTIPVILGKMREQISSFDEVDLRITLHLVRFGRRGGATDRLVLLAIACLSPPSSDTSVPAARSARSRPTSGGSSTTSARRARVRRPRSLRSVADSSGSWTRPTWTSRCSTSGTRGASRCVAGRSSARARPPSGRRCCT
jgi:hypothetical protein